MSTRRWAKSAAVLSVFAACAPVIASDLGHAPKLKTSVIPRKASSARDRASEVLQKTPVFVLADAYVERGVFEYSKKDFEQAARDFQSAIEMGSQAAVIYIARGLKKGD